MRHVLKKIYSGNVESYIKWKNQLDHVLKNSYCASSKDKLDMAESMLFGKLLEYWKLWRQTEAEKEIEKTFKSKETDTKYNEKVK